MMAVGPLTSIQEILSLMGSEIFQFGLGRAEKFGFKDFNFALILENTGIAMNRENIFAREILIFL